MKKRICQIAIVVCFVGMLSGCASTSLVIEDEETAERLRKIELPELDFQRATMPDALTFLASSIHCMCHPIVYPTQIIQGDSVLYSIPFDTYDAHDAHDPNVDAQLKGSKETKMLRRGPTLTMQMKDSTVMDVLRAITKAVNGTTTIQKELITIRTKNVEPPPIVDETEGQTYEDEYITSKYSVAEMEARTREAEYGLTLKAAETRMTKIVLPEVVFRQAQIRDIMAFFDDMVIEFGTGIESDKKKRLRCSLHSSAMNYVSSPDAFPKQPPLITFSAKKISLLEALNITAEYARCKLFVENNTVTLFHPAK